MKHQQKRKQQTPLKQQQPGYSPTGRKTRTDAGHPRLTPRDRFVLTWVGQQDAMRLDQVQELLGWFPGYGAAHQDQISEQSARSAINRWQKAEWVVAHRIDAQEPTWIWLTKKGLNALNLPYRYHSLNALSKQDRDHLYAITHVRLTMDDKEGIEWTSERTLLQGTHRRKWDERVHRPDAVYVQGDDLIAIEVELSRKTPALLSHILLSLLRRHDYHGAAYHALKAEKGEAAAQEESLDAWRQYTEVYYFAPPAIRRHIRRVLAKLVQCRVVSEEEAERIQVWWYPCAMTEEEEAQEQEEAHTPLDLDEDGAMVLDDQWDEHDT